MPFRTVIVRVSGKTPEQFDEIEPKELTKLLDNGFEIKHVHQIATQPTVGGGGSVLAFGSIILTYVLFKE
jgi:hypothetical protein